MQAVSANEQTPQTIYNTLKNLKTQDMLKSLDDAENVLSQFGANIKDRNIIKFDVEAEDRGIYKECLYEYVIPTGDGRYETFYVDKGLGFTTSNKLPDSYKDTIGFLHKKGGSFENPFTHTIH